MWLAALGGAAVILGAGVLLPLALLAVVACIKRWPQDDTGD